MCTGTLLLAGAGVVHGRRYTTHWAFADNLAALGEGEVVKKVGYIADGNPVTAAGVSAGIDMSLWLLGQMLGDEFARTTQKYMEYEPAPPYDVTGWVPEGQTGRISPPPCRYFRLIVSTKNRHYGELEKTRPGVADAGHKSMTAVR